MVHIRNFPYLCKLENNERTYSYHLINFYYNRKANCLLGRVLFDLL